MFQMLIAAVRRCRLLFRGSVSSTDGDSGKPRAAMRLHAHLRLCPPPACPQTGQATEQHGEPGPETAPGARMLPDFSPKFLAREDSVQKIECVIYVATG